MIRGLLDNDLYKFTMQQAVHRLYPDAWAEYRFFSRGKTPFPDGFARRVKREAGKLAYLCLSAGEKDFLADTCPFFTPVYLDFLSCFRFNPLELSVSRSGKTLDIRIRGPWYRTILWEVPLMAIISETYFSLQPGIEIRSEPRRNRTRERNREKAAALADQGVRFADFGTRRRFSAQNHENLIRDILDFPGHTLTGTSNVHFARKFNIPPIGTMAHEWVMFHSAAAGLRGANAAALDAWVRVYNGRLGIALTDTYTTGLFLKDFDSLRARTFDGVRQDSGNPVEFLEKLIAHYQALGIDPGAKTLVFSDGLDTDRALEVHNACDGRVKDVYGIGTHLTNDVGVEPLNMVIKMTRCRVSGSGPWQPVAKLSDDPGKHTGDTAVVQACLAELDKQTG